MSFGPYLAAAFVLWPVMAVLGGQGFAPLLGLAGIAALAVSRPRLSPAPFALIGLGFIAWAALSEVWAPGHRALFAGSLWNGDFAVRARSLAAILLFLTASLTIAATLRASPGPRASGVVVAMLGIQAATVIGLIFVSGLVLAAVYGEDPRRLQEGAQNISRNANTLALALPLLLPMLVLRLKSAGPVLAGLLAVGSGTAFVLFGNDSALVAMAGMVVAVALVALMPRTGFRWLFGALAGYIASAPVVFAVLIRALDPVAHYLPASFRSRLWSWEVVIARTSDTPFLGHGLGATRTWKETFATRPDWLSQLPDNWTNYPIVPGHPHNMALQIWAETGMVGAVLAALSLVALAFHLPRPNVLRPEIRFAVAGLAGAATSIFSFAYNLWNEGFWASLALAAAAIILWHRTVQETPE